MPTPSPSMDPSPTAAAAVRCAPLTFPLPNISQFVLDKLGDRCAVPSMVLPTVMVYGLILAIGLLGNLCTCLVILRNKGMHNATNAYLFSLAVSDLLLLVLGLPMELYGLFDVFYPYKFGEFVCKGRSFLIEFTSYASILTITCFSVERWLAICFPLRVKLFSTLDRAVTVILAVWVFAFVAASPVLDIVVVNKLPLPEWALQQHQVGWLPLVSDDNSTIRGTDTCAMDFHRPLAQRNFILLAFLLFFLLPAFLITVVYCHIVCRLCSSIRPPGNGSIKGSEQQQPNRSRKSLLKILVSVVFMFFLCWLPFHVQRLLSIFLNEMGAPADSQQQEDDGSTSALFALFNMVFYISGYCYYSNSAINPVIYNILSAKYRMAFCKTIFGERLAHKLLHGKCLSSVPVLHSHSQLQSRWSASSGQQLHRQNTTLSPQLSSAVQQNPNKLGTSRTLLLRADSPVAIKTSLAEPCQPMLWHKHSLGTSDRQNSHPSAGRNRHGGVRSGRTIDRKFSEEHWRKTNRERASRGWQNGSLRKTMNEDGPH